MRLWRVWCYTYDTERDETGNMDQGRRWKVKWEPRSLFPTLAAQAGEGMRMASAVLANGARWAESGARSS